MFLQTQPPQKSKHFKNATSALESRANNIAAPLHPINCFGLNNPNRGSADCMTPDDYLSAQQESTTECPLPTSMLQLHPHRMVCALQKLGSVLAERIFRGFLCLGRRIFSWILSPDFSPHFSGKRAQINPPGKSLANPPKFTYQKSPTHFCRGAGPTKTFGWKCV